MISKINKFLIPLLVVGISLYIVSKNDSIQTLVITDSFKLTHKLGILIIISFVTGLLFASFIAFLYGIKWNFRERSLLSQNKAKDQVFDKLLEAKSAIATGQWQRGKAVLEQMIKKDPKNLLLKLELAKLFKEEGKLQESLSVLDEARSYNSKNAAILFQASNLNQSIGNKTVALDNLTLAHEVEPSIKTATLCAALAEDLGKFSDSLKFYAFLSERKAGNVVAESRVKYKQLLSTLKEPTSAEDYEKTRKELQAFLKKNPSCNEVYLKIAECEEKLGRFDSAAQDLISYAKNEKTLASWQHVINFWVKHNNPDKVIATAKSANQELSSEGLQGKEKFLSELNIIKYLLQYNMLDQAESALKDFGNVIDTQNQAITSDMISHFYALQGLFYLRKDDLKSAALLWENLYNSIFDTVTNNKNKTLKSKLLKNTEAPSPILSTP